MPKRKKRRPIDAQQALVACTLFGAFVTVATQVDLQTRRVAYTLAGGKEITAGNAPAAKPVARIRKGHRGQITDSSGQILAEDIEAYKIELKPSAVPHSDAFYVALANAAGLSSTEIADVVQNSTQLATWDMVLTPDQKAQVESVKKTFDAAGLNIAVATGMRRYPKGVRVSSVLGGIWPAHQEARFGLELSQDEVLGGPVTLNKVKDPKTGKTLYQIAPNKKDLDGKDLGLTIDTEIQEAAFDAVKDAVTGSGADGGAAVVINPQTGAVLALVSYPFLDPAEPLPLVKPGQQVSSMVNLATQQRYEPGSTFKVLTAAKALDLGEAVRDGVITCNGILPIGKKSAIRCELHGGHRNHGPVAMDKAIAASCNVSAATWAGRIGYDEFLNFIDELGLSTKAGIGMPGEAAGSYFENDGNEPLQLANLGFGQSIVTNPVSLASAFTTLANNGVHVKARLIDSIGGQKVPSDSGHQIFSEETSQTMMDIMESVFRQGGTGYNLRIPGYRLAGKTGTAQKVGKNGADGYVSNFVGFVPAVSTKAVILVMVNNPKGEYHGAAIAGPAFRRIALKVIDHYGIKPTGGAE